MAAGPVSGQDFSQELSEVPVFIYVASCCLITISVIVASWLAYKRDCKQFWHHAVRLPSRMPQPYWYMISISTGCRPWAGHEGDIFLRMVGSRADSRTFIVNGEVHSRLWEADSHLYLYSSSWPLGEINYVIVACRSASRKKRWYLSSVQVKFVSLDPEKEKEWYFPYHEWIEVFHDPVKVTLCNVNHDHDINRRLMLGWLGRCVSDFHLWTSIFTPIKYTSFRRSDRIACISAQFAGSLMYIVVINGMIPQLGAIVLGLFGASCAIVPVATAEAVLRRVEWKRKILLEDVRWYKAAEEDDESQITKPRTYRQYVLKPSHKKMNYNLMFQDENPRKRKKKDKKLTEIIEDDGKFWHWLDPDIDLPPVIENSQSTINVVETESKKSVQEEEEDEEYTEDEDEDTWTGKLKKKMKKLVPWKSQEAEDSDALEPDQKLLTKDFPPGSLPPELTATKAHQLENIIRPVAVEDIQAVRVSDEFGREGVVDSNRSEDSEDDEKGKSKEETILYVGEGFLVQPVSVWQVDSDFSIDSLDLKGTDLSEFTAMESMPAAEFEGFKKRKVTASKTVEFTQSEMQIRNMMDLGRRGGIAEIRDTVSDDADKWGEDNYGNEDEIPLPRKISLLTAEENELVSWVYYDRCVHGNKWLKRETPLSSVLVSTEDSGGVRDVDWWGVDISSDGEDGSIRKYADVFRSEDYFKKKDAVRELRKLYPEPVPRERIFSMLMFPDYVTKLSQAYDQMVVDPECWSALADFYAEWADSDDGPLLFCEACINVAKLSTGGKIVHDILSCGRTSTAWTALVCELTQRLRYQGDNVERLKEKYGLENECLINATAKSHGNSDCSVEIDPGIIKMPQSAFDIGNLPSMESISEVDPETKPSLTCVYTELERLSEWRKKLSELDIVLKGCPMSELKDEEARKMSRFYRKMITAPGGCALFSELMRQITISNNKGRRMVCRIIRYVAGHNDGIPFLNQLLKGLGLTGISGRKILVRIFNLIENRKPSGPRVLTNLANALEMVEIGKLVLKDLQIDAARAHRRAHEVRQSIRRHLDPIIRINRQSVCQLVISLNEIAKYMLGVANNARSVLEGSETQSGQDPTTGNGIRDIVQNKDVATIDDPRPVNDNLWNSERNCCRNYMDLQQRINQSVPTRKKSVKEPEYFQLTDSSSEVPFVRRQPPKKEVPLVSDLWQPIDGRGDIINIYKKGDETPAPIPIRSEEGFSLPCKPKIHCEKQKRMNLNEFFLQSKDYERFNIDFRYKPSVDFKIPEPNHHHEKFDFDREISRCWKPPISTIRRNAYVGNQNTPTDQEQACVKWGKDYNPENAEDWGGVAMCTCHDKSYITKGKDGKHHCLICSIADKLKKVDNPQQVVDILTNECETFPEKSLNELKQLPVLERETIKKIQEAMQTKADIAPTPSGFASTSEEGKDQPKYKADVINIENERAPMPSGQRADDNVPDGITNEKFPFCGTRTEKVCTCIGGDKQRKSVSLFAKYLAMFNPDKNNTDNVASSPETADSKINHGCLEGTEKIISPSKISPDTALRRRQEAKDVTFTSKSPSEFYQHNQKTTETVTQDYQFPTHEKTSSEKIGLLQRKNDTEYWGRDDSEVSIFSHPPVATESIHCKECGGLLMPADNGELNAYNYLSKNGEISRQEDGITIDSSSASFQEFESDSTNKANNKITLENAMGCCNTPGCYARIPRNCRYRYGDVKAKEKQMQKYHNRVKDIEEDIKGRYKEWIKDSPCGKPVCTKVHKSGTDSQISDTEQSDESTLKLPDVGFQLVSESTGRIVNPTKNYPITAKSLKVEENRKLLDEVCDLCKLPKFECCDVNDSDDSTKQKQIAGRYCLCRHVDDSIDGKFFTVLSSNEKPHSVCSECHVRVGTQQRPPCVRYLLPLKIVRCYENTLAKYGKPLPESSDSGLSMDTAMDMHNEDDLFPLNETEQMTLLDLMGLSSKPGKKRRRSCRPKRTPEKSSSLTTVENCSVCSSTSSGVCCHVHSSRLLPVLHLQGFTCKNSEQYSDKKDYPALTFKWWQSHEKSLQAMQSCADACVCLRIILEKDKSKALTDHEISCKVCSVVGGDGTDGQCGKLLGPRYSEFLPIVWRSEIRSMGRRGERSSIVELRRPRFYKQLINAIVESTRMLLLTPDLRPQRLTPAMSIYDRLFPAAKDEPGSSNDDSEMERAQEGGEEYVTTAHVARLAHFRAMMKCLNDIQYEGSRLRSCKLVGDRDVTRVTLLDQQKHDKKEDKLKEKELNDSGNESITKNDKVVSLIDLIINFIKNKACGSILDCRELLEAPWELPAEQQQIAGRMLKKIDSVLSGKSESSFKAADKLSTWDDSLSCIVDAYLNEVVFRAVAQNNILKAIRRSSTAKRQMLKVADLSRIVVARLVRFTELAQSATSNLKGAIKDGLAAVDGNNNKENLDNVSEKSASKRTSQRKSTEELDAQSKVVKSHISALLRTGRDDRRATLDDVFISFERLRCDVLDDLSDAATLVKQTSDLGDDRALWLLNSANARFCDKNASHAEELKCWTESEIDHSEIEKDFSIIERIDGSDHSSDTSQHTEEVASLWPDLNRILLNREQTEDKSSKNNGDTARSTTELSETDQQSNVEESLANALLLSERAKQWQDGSIPHPSSGVIDKSMESGLNKTQSADTRSFATCVTRPNDSKRITALDAVKQSSDLRDVSIKSPPPSASGRFTANKINTGTQDLKFGRNELVQEELIEEINKMTEEELPHRFHSVFKLTSLTDFKQDKHTRTALQADKGKGMLQCIFGTDMTEVEMVEAFHDNIRTLLKWQKSRFPVWAGLVARLMLILFTVGSAIGACFFPFFLEARNYVLLSAIPVAIFGHGLVLEPLKCLFVSWIMFLSRHKSAFHNNPVYMKSSVHLLRRARLSHPRVSDEFRIITEEDPEEDMNAKGDLGDEYYYKFCDNKASTRLFDRRRRKLPVMTEHDLSLDLHAVTSYGALPGAIPNEITPSSSEAVTSTHSAEFISLPPDETSDFGGYRRDAIDMGGNKSQSVSVTSSDKPEDMSNLQPDVIASELDVDLSSSISSEEKPKHTPIIYCRYSNMPSQ
uniref:uncharacterized protein LOC120340947 n=1 Tax=Styela clava TaxID=7725 RepID=UPI00193A3159|nr:uncharacterized protein LOC120340947 [Styela clava]